MSILRHSEHMHKFPPAFPRDAFPESTNNVFIVQVEKSIDALQMLIDASCNEQQDSGKTTLSGTFFSSLFSSFAFFFTSIFSSSIPIICSLFFLLLISAMLDSLILTFLNNFPTEKERKKNSDKNYTFFCFVLFFYSPTDVRSKMLM